MLLQLYAAMPVKPLVTAEVVEGGGDVVFVAVKEFELAEAFVGDDGRVCECLRTVMPKPSPSAKAVMRMTVRTEANTHARRFEVELEPD